MATPSKIKVMLSSRCNDLFPSSGKGAKLLSKIREELKEQIEAATILEHSLYEVWINEKAFEDAGEESWQKCLKQAIDCDIFIAIFNGNAGWSGRLENKAMGICHAEFLAAYNSAPGKVFVVNVWDEKSGSVPHSKANTEFQSYIQHLRVFDARGATTEPELIAKVIQTVVHATIRLVQRGVREAGRGKYYLGPALKWSTLNYAERASAMEQTAAESLGGKLITTETKRCLVERKVRGDSILFSVSAIPDALSVPTARELVGQPHLSDHSLAGHLKKMSGGPIHLIACTKNVTESQAVRMLGFPNATVLSPPFGIYVVDPVQSIQLVLVAQCRDSSTTRHGVQGFLQWLDESDQDVQLVRHAAKRKVVVAALAG
jgi:hypothetical protein